jgi:hypothetical protein
MKTNTALGLSSGAVTSMEINKWDLSAALRLCGEY